jgi:hypothetical protein
MSTDTTTVDLEATDISGQKKVKLTEVPPDSSVGELVQDLIDELQLKKIDSSGRSLSYHALRHRESRHLHATEFVGEALQPGDRITLQPDIDAGLDHPSRPTTAGS